MITVALMLVACLTGGVEDASASIQKIRDKHAVPGLVAGCVTRDGVEVVGVAGVRRKGEDAPLKLTDRMHLGSCNKAITATLAASLVADGKLKWESTIGQVLGAAEPQMNEGWRHVTLEQLLRHRGGAPAGAQPGDWNAAWNCTDPAHKCREAFVHALLLQAPAQAPGTHQYSNQGYSIVGRMCEAAAGEPYETLLKNRILDPLGVTDWGFGAPVKSAPESPSGHNKEGKPDNTDNPNSIAPAGTLHMPVEQWMKIVAFHLGAKPLTALVETSKQLQHLHKGSGEGPNEAMGWYCATRPWGGNVITHSGSNNLWFCVAWLSPEKGFAVVAACNQGGDAASKACDEACASMISAHITAEAHRVIKSREAPGTQK
jgi:CubicO group peptidase (beta-lactamase class C family)